MNPFIRKIIFSLIISMLCTEISAKIAPDYIQICPGLKSDCLKDITQKIIPHFVKGIPSLGLQSTDPLELGDMKFDLPGGLKIEIFKGNLTGARNCIVDSMKFENAEIDATFHCDFAITTNYIASGKVLLFTLDGEGDALIEAKNVIIDAKIIFEDKVRNGVEYYEAKNIKAVYRFGDRVSFNLTNLFKGNSELSKTILDFLNENWEQVLDEFAKPILEPVIEITLNVIKKFFKGIPKNELIVF